MAQLSTQKITPFLWFEANGQEGAEYYTSIFPNSRIISKAPMVTTFELCGQRFSILEAGPHDTFNDSVSFYIDCKDQEEVDYYWNTLVNDGGKESMCGWLQDKYGVRWQIVPEALITLSNDSDAEKARKVFGAMMKMKKIIFSELEEAYNS
ncbi:VOC family protein [Fulvivirga sp. 29W222]|uniref:VOC family protein n=1 Tax=Fulvivirga marina TaxID=2494733 RepID=A0A937FXN0_9BACT|nr:VOC family protein [Fulvivirga marina]MBL6447944.1 VOC family protein [Fulvivirga marina]